MRFDDGNMTTEFEPMLARTAAFITANAPTTGQTPPGALKQGINTQGGGATTRCRRDAALLDHRAVPPGHDEEGHAAPRRRTPQGFTLQAFEGASIDERDHAADICGQIGETIAFDEAIGEALDFQAAHPETLILMTADHAHSSQIIAASATPATGPRSAR